MQVVERGDARIAYQKSGSGPTVLLVQGVGLGGSAWAPQVEHLASRFTAVSVDNRGIGSSTYAGGPVTVEEMARDALAVMDAEGVERCHVVGHSLGGVIAQELALLGPARVASLSLICTFVRGRDAIHLDGPSLWTGMRTRIGTRGGRRRAFLEMIVPTDGRSEAELGEIQARLSALFERDLADQPPIAMRQLKALTRYDARDRLISLRGIPTLVMSAELDAIARPESGRALAAAIPGARYLELPGVGHAVPAYRPEVVNQPLLEHLVAAESERRVQAS